LIEHAWNILLKAHFSAHLPPLHPRLMVWAVVFHCLAKIRSQEVDPFIANIPKIIAYFIDAKSSHIP
jgi:hypothetical protein